LVKMIVQVRGMRREKGKGERLGAWLELAKRAARKAGVVQAEHLGNLPGYRLKGVANLVTEVDLLCEKEVISTILCEEPEHKVLSEEQGGAGLDSEYLWVIDPLDGTTNYAHGYLKFCVSIALVKRGKPLLGVVYDQFANEMFYAGRGSGAFLNGQSIRVSEVARLEDSLLVTGFSYDRGQKLCENLEAFQKILPYPHAIRVDGSAALDLCYVACGRFDGFWERRLNAWDIAAGMLIVEEAGGRVSGFDGRPIPLDKKQLWASNGKIHEEFLSIFNREAKGGKPCREKV